MSVSVAPGQTPIRHPTVRSLRVTYTQRGDVALWKSLNLEAVVRESLTAAGVRIADDRYDGTFTISVAASAVGSEYKERSLTFGTQQTAYTTVNLSFNGLLQIGAYSRPFTSTYRGKPSTSVIAGTRATKESAAYGDAVTQSFVRPYVTVLRDVLDERQQLTLGEKVLAPLPPRSPFDLTPVKHSAGYPYLQRVAVLVLKAHPDRQAAAQILARNLDPPDLIQSDLTMDAIVGLRSEAIEPLRTVIADLSDLEPRQSGNPATGNSFCRSRAANALAGIGDPKGVAILIDAMRTGVRRSVLEPHEQDQALGEYVRVLGTLKAAEAVADLIAILETEKTFADFTRAMAAKSLGEIKDARALPALRRASVSGVRMIRDYATEALKGFAAPAGN